MNFFYGKKILFFFFDGYNKEFGLFVLNFLFNFVIEMLFVLRIFKFGLVWCIVLFLEFVKMLFS